MNSEITHVSKLVPVPVLRNKQNDSKEVAANASTAKEQQVGVESSKEALKTQPAALNAEAKEASLDSVKSAAATGNSIFQSANRNLEFQVDDSTQKVVVKIIDSKTGDLVRQIPSEDMLAFVRRMQELEGDNQGTMLQDKV
ncbi:flagellar protein FlaG [Methylobacter sp. G7]|uniref:flagellar protein FlaG n=1 Tax=Methylobacter sp. G7 TaxID=3230117 RepID=UPI003D806A93